MTTQFPKFINQIGNFYNIGDVLCSPKHYYVFHPAEKYPDVVIIGGGAFSRLGVTEAKAHKPANSILWAVGRTESIHKGNGLGIKSSLARIFNEIDASRTHVIASVRDKCFARFGIRFVPCPSVHHPLTSVQPSSSLGIFINANTDVSGLDSSQLVNILAGELGSETIFGSNGDDISKFINDFSQTGRVITNSYHVCYWSLLSGRQVKPIGCSTKLVNLLRLFDIHPDKLITYKRGDSNSLVASIKTAMNKTDSWLSLNKPDYYKDQFKSINDEFASEIVKKEIFSNIEKKKCIDI